MPKLVYLGDTSASSFEFDENFKLSLFKTAKGSAEKNGLSKLHQLEVREKVERAVHHLVTGESLTFEEYMKQDLRHYDEHQSMAKFLVANGTSTKLRDGIEVGNYTWGQFLLAFKPFWHTDPGSINHTALLRHYTKQMKVVIEEGYKNNCFLKHAVELEVESDIPISFIYVGAEFHPDFPTDHKTDYMNIKKQIIEHSKTKGTDQTPAVMADRYLDAFKNINVGVDRAGKKYIAPPPKTNNQQP